MPSRKKRASKKGVKKQRPIKSAASAPPKRPVSRARKAATPTKRKKRKTPRPAKQAAKKRSKKLAKRSAKKPARIARPIPRYREPVSEKRLAGLSARDAKYLVRLERKLLASQLQAKLIRVRQFFHGFEAKDGYPLDAHGIVRLHTSKLAKLNRTHETIARATSVPYITFTPKNDAEKRAAIARAGELGENQKVYIIHHMDADRARAYYVPDETGGDEYGTVEIKTNVKGGAIFERIYYFPKQPKTWAGVIQQAELLMKKGMRTGFYQVYNNIYGAIGSPDQREKLVEMLELFWSTYSKWLAGTILGFVWAGSTIDSTLKRMDKVERITDRFQRARQDKKKRDLAKLRRKAGFTTSRKKRAKPRAKK